MLTLLNLEIHHFVIVRMSSSLVPTGDNVSVSGNLSFVPKIYCW